MNVTQILLGSTAAMLLMALILSFNSMKKGEVNDHNVQRYVELEKENARLQGELTSIRTGQPAAAPIAPPEAPASASKEEIEALKEKNRLLAERAEQEKVKRERAEKETLAMNERYAKKRDKYAQRQRLIAKALTMARVKGLGKSDDGKIEFVILATTHANVRVGSRLAIRRGTGILGMVEITRLDAEACIADPLMNPGGTIDIKVGDELILPPE
ncbi:MAG: hypothetical protein ACPG6P_13880 [Akkermansiaceae bacterium]